MTSARKKLTPAMRASLLRLIGPTAAGDWSRSLRAGERVTLAALHAHRLVVRRAWRGTEGDADAAYEYKVSPELLEATRAKNPAGVERRRIEYLQTKETA